MWTQSGKVCYVPVTVWLYQPARITLDCQPASNLDLSVNRPNCPPSRSASCTRLLNQVSCAYSRHVSFSFACIAFHRRSSFSVWWRLELGQFLTIVPKMQSTTTSSGSVHLVTVQACGTKPEHVWYRCVGRNRCFSMVVKLQRLWWGARWKNQNTDSISFAAASA